ncbi:hypothetical protein [Pantoea stewartii]|uniref:hypothetical protein n=1 Tax=Pantoea stewartii TaxID=66269 RepID=UPI0036334474
MCCSAPNGELTAAGEARNNQHESIIAGYDSPSTPWVWAAACYGRDGNQPAKRMSGPSGSDADGFPGVLAPPLASALK